MHNNSLLFILCLDYTSILFLLGFCGLIVNRRNIILMLLSLELTFLASALNFIFVGSLLHTFIGSIYGILIILVVIADTVMGLSLVILGYRSSKFSSLNTLCAI